jgi:hypothetical protein
MRCMSMMSSRRASGTEQPIRARLHCAALCCTGIAFGYGTFGQHEAGVQRHSLLLAAMSAAGLPEGVRAAGAAGVADIAGQVPAWPGMVCPWF